MPNPPNFSNAFNTTIEYPTNPIKIKNEREFELLKNNKANFWKLKEKNKNEMNNPFLMLLFKYKNIEPTKFQEGLFVDKKFLVRYGNKLGNLIYASNL